MATEVTVEEAIAVLSKMPKNWKLAVFVSQNRGDVPVLNIQQDRDKKIAVIRLESEHG